MMIETELCKMAFKYGTDKCPRIKHAYTPYYYELLKDKRDGVKKVMELGIGWYEGSGESDTNQDDLLNRIYHKGASLLMWRDFFPNAQIYGIDIKKEIMLEADRIKTFTANAKKEKHWAQILKETGTDIDVFIDDGSHFPGSQAFVANHLMPRLKKDVIYIIEDVRSPSKVLSMLDDNLIGDFPDLPYIIKGDRLMIIKHK